MSGDLSVVMPLYNAAPWVESAVRSVLDNADGLLELIVVDDGSTDESAEIVAAIEGPIKLIHQQNAGPSAARNTGVAAASGALLGFLDSDDLWRVQAPDPRRAAIEAGAEVAFGLIEIVAGDPPRLFAEASPSPNIGTMLIRREAFDRVGGFDESRTYGEDVDWLLRSREAGLKAERLDVLALTYRMRKGSLMRVPEATPIPGMLSALRSSLERRGKIGRNAEEHGATEGQE